MLIYIRDKTFSNIQKLTCIEYDLYNDIANSSSFTVVGGVDQSYKGGVVCVYPPAGAAMASHASIIDTLTPKDGCTTIKTKPLIEIFDRDIPWLETPTDPAYKIITMISANWGSGQSDSAYAATWIDTHITFGASVQTPKLDDVGFFNLKDFLEDLFDRGVVQMSAYADATYVTFAIDYASGGADAGVRMDLTCGAYELDSESYSSKGTAKITLHTYDEETATWTATDYYLFEDGTYSTDPTAGTRASGEWKHLLKKTEDDVAAEFQKAKLEHKIKFYARADIPAAGNGALVSLRMPDGRVVTSNITAVKHSSKDVRTYYECGTLATTLTDMIKRGVKI